MITVKLYGLLRLDSGIKELQIDANSMSSLFEGLEKYGLNKSALSSVNILVNGELAHKRTTLNDGDTVQLFPPVAGG